MTSDTSPEARLRRFADIFEATPFTRLVGTKVEELGEDHARLRLPFRPELVRTMGVVHGGAIATLVDNAAAIVVFGPEMAKPGARPPQGATIDMNIHYLNSAVRQDLVAGARVIKRGRTITVVEVDVKTPDETPVARGLVTYLTK